MLAVPSRKKVQIPLYSMLIRQYLSQREREMWMTAPREAWEGALLLTRDDIERRHPGPSYLFLKVTAGIVLPKGPRVYDNIKKIYSKHD